MQRKQIRRRRKSRRAAACSRRRAITPTARFTSSTRRQAALPETLRDRVDFLLVSFDSKRDTPEALRAYRERQKLDTAHWTLLRGKPDDVRELAALLGANYREDARGQFAHSNLITVLNPQGEIVHQQAGLNSDPAPTIAAIQRALAPVAPQQKK
ncbi:MAG: SCO family protein [Verrucomicrobia bacterium]|nr:SCO family protein [Verrucomicrobiota bacterium]